MALTIYNPVAGYVFFGEGWGWGSTNDELFQPELKNYLSTNSTKQIRHLWFYGMCGWSSKGGRGEN